MPEPPGAVHGRGHVAAIPINDLNSDFCALNHYGIGPLHFLPAIIAIKLNMFCQRGIARLAAQRRVSASVNQSHIHSFIGRVSPPNLVSPRIPVSCRPG